MIDPITAMAAVTSAVNLIKKAAATVDDVRSLGPLLGRYFDAKQSAVKAVKQNKKAGGSNMARAIEIELALKQQEDFEKQLQMLFFQTNNMDVWDNIQKRVAEMNRQDILDERKARDLEKQRQREIESMIINIAVVLLAVIIMGTVGFFAYMALSNA